MPYVVVSKGTIIDCSDLVDVIDLDAVSGERSRDVLEGVLETAQWYDLDYVVVAVNDALKELGEG